VFPFSVLLKSHIGAKPAPPHFPLIKENLGDVVPRMCQLLYLVPYIKGDFHICSGVVLASRAGAGSVGAGAGSGDLLSFFSCAVKFGAGPTAGLAFNVGYFSPFPVDVASGIRA